MQDNFNLGNSFINSETEKNKETQEQKQYVIQHSPEMMQQRFSEELELIGDLVTYQIAHDEDGKEMFHKDGTPVYFELNHQKQISSIVKYDDKFQYDLKRAYETYDSAVNQINQRVSIDDNEIIKDNVLADLAKIILDDAIEEQVEDVFIESYEHFGMVRFFDGAKWHNQRLLAKSVTDPLITILKFMAGMETKIENSYKKQTNGTIYHNHNNFRIATGRAKFGMFMSLRLESGYFSSLDDLGLPDMLKRAFRERLKANSGLVVITGGTGSGKSTLGTAGLVERQKQAHGQLNVISLEKPIEVSINGILQIEINEDKGLTWSDAIEGTLRERPDILRVGEVNGKEEAQAMVRVGNAGCTSITTLHANTALNVFDTLRAYDISEMDIQNALKLSIYLARVPKLCPKCRESISVIASADELNWVQQHLTDGEEPKNFPMIYKRHKEGCEYCRRISKDESQYGTIGKVGLYEYLRVNSAVLNVMRKFKGKETAQIKYALMHPNTIKWNDNEINKADIAKLNDSILYEPLEKDVFRRLADGSIDLETAKRVIDR